VVVEDHLSAGDIVLQRAVPVGPADTATDLFHRTVDLIGPIVVDALAAIAAGERDFVKQDPASPTRTRTRSATTEPPAAAPTTACCCAASAWTTARSWRPRSTSAPWAAT
jgi:hypothetical protein